MNEAFVKYLQQEEGLDVSEPLSLEQQIKLSRFGKHVPDQNMVTQISSNHKKRAIIQAIEKMRLDKKRQGTVRALTPPKLFAAFSMVTGYEGMKATPEQAAEVGHDGMFTLGVRNGLHVPIWNEPVEPRPYKPAQPGFVGMDHILSVDEALAFISWFSEEVFNEASGTGSSSSYSQSQPKVVEHWWTSFAETYQIRVEELTQQIRTLEDAAALGTRAIRETLKEVKKNWSEKTTTLTLKGEIEALRKDMEAQLKVLRTAKGPDAGVQQLRQQQNQFNQQQRNQDKLRKGGMTCLPFLAGKCTHVGDHDNLVHGIKSKGSAGFFAGITTAKTGAKTTAEQVLERCAAEEERRKGAGKGIPKSKEKSVVFADDAGDAETW